ncbi:hypothetical protein F4782DRAFT_352081 [Xylaria castorea]|nr:hypothetical protein F4782DRAFT_352081 [Xylaria castorea]
MKSKAHGADLIYVYLARSVSDCLALTIMSRHFSGRTRIRHTHTSRYKALISHAQGGEALQHWKRFHAYTVLVETVRRRREMGLVEQPCRSANLNSADLAPGDEDAAPLSRGHRWPCATRIVIGLFFGLWIVLRPCKFARCSTGTSDLYCLESKLRTGSVRRLLVKLGMSKAECQAACVSRVHGSLRHRQCCETPKQQSIQSRRIMYATGLGS